MKISIIMAQTVDGKIAKSKDHLANWTSKEDKKHFISETKKSGVIVMGKSTFDTIGKPLPGRLNLILTKDPEKYAKKIKPGTLEFFSGTADEVIKHLAKRGFNYVLVGGGAYTNKSFLEAGLVHEILLTTEGILFGQGFGFCEGLEKDIKLKVKKIKQLSDYTFITHYEVLNKKTQHYHCC